jgi:hypothetical protein
LVSGVIAASSNLVWEQSTKEIFNPNSLATLLKYVFVPKAEENQIKWKEHYVKDCLLFVKQKTLFLKCKKFSITNFSLVK